MRVLEVVIRRRLVVGDELSPGQAEVDRHPVAIAMAMMVTGQLDHDVAGDDAVEDLLELFGPPLHVGGECFRVGHTPERDLKGYLHAEYLLRSPTAPFVRARGAGDRFETEMAVSVEISQIARPIAMSSAESG
jgi:hypothetical protein